MRKKFVVLQFSASLYVLSFPAELAAFADLYPRQDLGSGRTFHVVLFL
jgi:hypothetical protein